MPLAHLLKLVAQLAITTSLVWLQSTARGENTEKRADKKPSAAEARDAKTEAAEQELSREGGKLTDEVGYFRLTGDRATFFYRDGKAQVNALENLALERISQIVGETPSQLTFSVSGTLTEYRGHNYLLITRATIKRKAPANVASK